MENLLKQILLEQQIENTTLVESTLAKLESNAKVFELAKNIRDLKSQIIELFYMYKDKEEFKEVQLTIPNGNVKKEYDFQLEMEKFPSIKIHDIKNLELVGLQYDPENCRIFGIPNNPNQIEIQIEFFSIKDENCTLDIKVTPLIVNADPKDLWLNIPSPKESRFYKDEEKTYSGKFLDKKIVVASKRGRSHAHVGSFRDDDFEVSTLPNNWSIVALADGAGSAKAARAGSQFACENIVRNFSNEQLLQELSLEVENYFTIKPALTLEEDIRKGFPKNDGKELAEKDVLSENKNDQNAEASVKSKSVIINTLYTQVKNLHAQLVDFAKNEDLHVKDLHTTLIFILVKKFSFGYVILSFGVGDCPVVLLEENCSKVNLLNILDVGEYGGGTRFITMPEIFSRPDMVDRFGIYCFTDFSRLFLMTDGIYDPKFAVESNLENLEVWRCFLNDLSGENEDRIKVEFENESVSEKQLSNWMDFWSKGNHDDRTLAVIY